MPVKKYSKRIERRSFLHAIDPVDGWVLITKDEDAKAWHVAWLEIFGTKSGAMAFAKANGWPSPFKAVRASLTVTIN